MSKSEEKTRKPATKKSWQNLAGNETRTLVESGLLGSSAEPAEGESSGTGNSTWFCSNFKIYRPGFGFGTCYRANCEFWSSLMATTTSFGSLDRPQTRVREGRVSGFPYGFAVCSSVRASGFGFGLCCWANRVFRISLLLTLPPPK